MVFPRAGIERPNRRAKSQRGHTGLIQTLEPFDGQTVRHLLCHIPSVDSYSVHSLLTATVHYYHATLPACQENSTPRESFSAYESYSYSTHLYYARYS